MSPTVTYAFCSGIPHPYKAAPGLREFCCKPITDSEGQRTGLCASCRMQEKREVAA